MNVDTLIRDNIKKLKPYSSARDEFKEASSDMIFVDANENPYGEKLNRYPDPQQRLLKEVLSEQKGIAPSQILIGNGSDEVLDLIFRVFCEPNQDTVITLPPTYGMYQVLANTNAIGLIAIPLLEDFQPNVDAILNTQNENTKLLFLCSPNNPTANSLDTLAVEKLIKAFKGIVVIDEAYIDFSSQESWLRRLNEFPNLIVTQTLSKAYGLAGIRLGTCYASKAIIEILNKIKPPYNVNQLTQEVALEALSNTQKTLEEVKTIIEGKDTLANELAAIDFVKKIYPSDANFLLIKVDDANKRYEQLIKKGIVVRNRSTQLRCENCLRITIGTEEENKELIKVLKELK